MAKSFQEGPKNLFGHKRPEDPSRLTLFIDRHIKAQDGVRITRREQEAFDKKAEELVRINSEMEHIASEIKNSEEEIATSVHGAKQWEIVINQDLIGTSDPFRSLPAGAVLFLDSIQSLKERFDQEKKFVSLDYTRLRHWESTTHEYAEDGGQLFRYRFILSW